MTMQRLTSLGAMLATGIFLRSACQSTDPKTGNDSELLAPELSTALDTTDLETDDQEPPTGRWVLESGTINGDPVTSITEHLPTLTFDESSIGGRFACHEFDGSAEYPGPGQVEFETSIPDILCDSDDAADIGRAAETFVLGLVRYVKTWRIEDDTLVLSGPSTEIIFTR